MSVQDLGGWLDDNIGTLAGIGGAIALAEDIRGDAADASGAMTDLGTQLAQDSAFTGYGVHTGLGSSTITPSGGLILNVGPDRTMATGANAAFGTAQGAAGNALAAAAAGGMNPYSGQAANMITGATNPYTGQAMDLFAGAGNAQTVAALQGMDQASALAGASSSNPMFDQAAGMMGQGANLAMSNAGNAQLGQALGMIGRASGLAGASSTNPYQAMAAQAQQGALAGLGGQQAGALGASSQAMQNAMRDTAGREQEVYDRIMAMQQPSLDRAQAAQQAREFAQGRSGIGGSQFGGTQEDAAMARARAEASNAAAVQAMGQAQSEMMNQANMAGQFGQLGQSAAGMQSNIGSSLGQLGAQGAQLGQSAAQIQGQLGSQVGSLGAQNAQLGQSAAGLMGTLGGQLGSLGSDQARLGQSAAQIQGQIANQRGQLGAQNAQLAIQQGQAMQNAGLQNAQLGIQQGQALQGIGVQDAGLAQGSAGLFNQIANQQAQMGNQMYQNQFTPIQQQLNAIQVANQTGQMAQTGQLTGTGYQAQLGLGGIQAQVNADKAASELYGNTLVGLLNAQAAQNSATTSAGGGLFSTLASYI